MINWLDQLLFSGRLLVARLGAAAPTEPTLNFTQAAVTLADNPGSLRTDVTFGVATPSADGWMSSADKAKLDLTGTLWRSLVRVVVASNVSLSAFPVLQGGITIATGDTALLAGQTDPTQNGPYVVGSPIVDGLAPLTRATWADSSSDFTIGMRVAVGPEDPVFAGEDLEFATTTTPFVLGTTPVTFGFAGSKSQAVGGRIVRRGDSGELFATYLDSGANADLPIKRNGTTILTLGAALVTLGVASLAFDPNVGATSIAQPQRTGSGVIGGSAASLRAQQGQAQTGVNNNNDGGDLTLGGGLPGTGGSGAVGHTGGTKIDLGQPVANVSAKLSILVAGTAALEVSETAAGVVSVDAKTNVLRLTGSSVLVATLSTGVVKAATGTLSSSLLVDADVSASAAIAGTKVAPNFGSQNVVTTGTATAISLDSGSNVDLVLKRNATTIASVTTTGLTFDIAIAGVSLKQTAKASDVATNDLTVTPQAAFATATGANRHPGNCVVALNDSTNGGGAALNPAFSVTQSGRPVCLISSRRDTASSAYGAIWLGNVTTSTASEANMCFGSDGSSVAFLNAPASGTLYLTIGLSTLAQVMTASQNQIGIPQWAWNDGLTPSILQAQSSSGVGATFTFKAAQGKAGSVGGILLLGGGAGGTGGTNLAGATQIDLGTAVSNASAKLSLLVGGASVLDVSQTAAATVTMTATSSLIIKGASTWFTGNATGIAFYAGAPVAQQTRAGQLTGAFGSTGTAIADVGAAFSQSTLNNNFRALEDAYNRLETIIHNLALST